MSSDALANRGAAHGHAAQATTDERIAALPEPWRTRTRRELAILTARIESTLEDDQAETG